MLCFHTALPVLKHLSSIFLKLLDGLLWIFGQHDSKLYIFLLKSISVISFTIMLGNEINGNMVVYVMGPEFILCPLTKNGKTLNILPFVGVK